MIDPGWYLAYVAVLLLCGATAGALLGYAARRAGRSAALIGWLVVAVMFGLGWLVGDRMDRAWLFGTTVIVLLGWPVGGIVGERAFVRWQRRRGLKPLDRPQP
jgi:hypothetical protein